MEEKPLANGVATVSAALAHYLLEPEFNLEKHGERVSGIVISPSFAGKRPAQRQQLIWDSLDASLGSESTRLIGMLLAYTPEEWNTALDADAE